MLHIFATFRSFTFQLFRVPALFAAFVLLICLTAAQLTLAQTYSQNIFDLPGSKFSPLAKVSDSSSSLANNNLTAKPAALLATLVVDDDGACSGATFSTINAAVAAASPGDTIQVCAGTYNESVNVNKTLTILGAQSGVDARTRTGATGTESVVNSTGTPGFDVGFNVTANGVVIDGFTVQDGATVGIYLLGTSSGYRILNNIIQNNTIGLYLNSNGAQQTIVRNNAFRTNNLPGSASGDGIYSDQSARVLIDANSFTGHAADSMIFTGTQSNITVSDNQLTSDNKSMVFLSTNGLVITRNTITTPLDEAIELDGGNNNVSINCNTIVGSPFNGISVENPHDVGPNTDVRINNNNIQGNVVAGLEVTNIGYTATLNAENNYWGSPSGPMIASNPGGTGDKIIDPNSVVDYMPFLTTLSSCAPTPTPTPMPTPTPTPQTCTPTTTVSEGDLFPGGIVSFGVSSGLGSVTVDHVNAGTGLQSLTVVGVPTNAVVNIPAFTPGTFNPVNVTFTPINPALPVDFTLRAASAFHAANIRVRCGTLLANQPRYEDGESKEQ